MVSKKQTNEKKMKSWFMENIILPNSEIIDKPGYIVSVSSGKGSNFYVREVLFPEEILANIETKFSEKFGNEGKKAVYTAGHLWGARYGATTNVPKKSTMPKEDFIAFVGSFVQFLNAEFASKMTHKLDLSKNSFELTSEDLMVCRHNGLGYFLLGTLTGFWRYLNDDPKIEGIQTNCQGRHNQKCVMLCAPSNYIDKKDLMVVKTPSNVELEVEYPALNKLKRSENAKNSFKDLLENGIIKYEGGFFTYKNERLFFPEASAVYAIETTLEKFKGGSEIIFNCAFEYFKKFGKKQLANERLITDFLPALGWGDVLVDSTGKKVFCTSYPWTKYYSSTTFPLFRGMLSGLVSSFKGKDILFKHFDAVISSDSLNLVLEAE